VAANENFDRAYWRTVRLMAVPIFLMVVFVVIVMIWVRNTVSRMLTIWEKRVDRHS
jgi:hypothetical protein